MASVTGYEVWDRDGLLKLSTTDHAEVRALARGAETFAPTALDWTVLVGTCPFADDTALTLTHLRDYLEE